LSALYQGHWKLVDGPNPELYDLDDDPLARENLSTARPEDVARLQAVLHALRSKASTQTRQNHSLSREDKRRLEALGYARSVSGSAPSSDLGLDPSSMMPLLARLDSIVGLANREIPIVTRLSALREGIWLPAEGRDVIGLIEEIAERNPDFSPAYLYLYNLYQKQGRHAEASAAEKSFRALVRGRAVE
jgi:hypothetical protein